MRAGAGAIVISPSVSNSVSAGASAITSAGATASDETIYSANPKYLRAGWSSKATIKGTKLEFPFSQTKAIYTFIPSTPIKGISSVVGLLLGHRSP